MAPRTPPHHQLSGGGAIFFLLENFFFFVLSLRAVDLCSESSRFIQVSVRKSRHTIAIVLIFGLFIVQPCK